MQKRAASRTENRRRPKAAAKSRHSTRRKRAHRLSEDVRASTIGLEVELDPKSTTFRGLAWYALELSRRKRVIELHAIDLHVSRVTASFRNPNGESEKRIGHVEIDRANETIRLCFERFLPAGAVRIELRFRGRVRKDLRGLYRGSAAPDSRESWIATQLCPTDARRFFPCFDEPGMKSRYAVRVIAPDDQTVIGNAPIKQEEPFADGRKRVDFESTPPLSSYLVALAVGPFESSEVRHVGPTPVRVYTLPGQQELAHFALEAGCASLKRLEAWFDTPHPYAKLDLVALPDFAFGAMENAGAVFFRDSILLLDAQDASPVDRKRTAEVIAHELSHMWFGNWVTMAWWNDLWLNEAFATWMAYVIIDDWQPDWQIWLDFAHRRVEALEKDALESSHPIAPPIYSADEAQENFDAITYTKGACVLRMLERYLGRETFQAGIRLYVRRHCEANATAFDLWKALKQVSDEPVEKIVAPWILQTGFPLLEVAQGASGASRPDTLRIEQNRFLALPRDRARAPDARWTIPWIGRTFRTANGRRKSVSPDRLERNPRSTGIELRALLTRKRERIELDAPLRHGLYPNADEAAFLRIEADPTLRRAVLLNLPRLSAIERIGWIDNAFALLHTNRIPLAECLETLRALANETEPEVLASLERVLARIAQRLPRDASPAASRGFRDWIVASFGAGLDAANLDSKRGEPDRTRAAFARRIAIVGSLGRSEPIVARCKARTRAALSEGRALEPALAAEVMRVAAHGGDRALHDAFRQATLAARTPQERRCSFFALAAFDDPELLAPTFEAALDTRLAPAPDRAQLLALLLGRSDSANRAWTQLKRHWRKLEKSMPPILLARLAGATSSALAPNEAPGLRRFFETHPLAAGSRVLDQIAEELAIAERFEQTAGPDFEAIFGA